MSSLEPPTFVLVVSWPPSAEQLVRQSCSLSEYIGCLGSEMPKSLEAVRQHIEVTSLRYFRITILGAAGAPQSAELAAGMPDLLNQFKQLPTIRKDLVLRWTYYLEVADFETDMHSISGRHGVPLQAKSTVVIASIPAYTYDFVHKLSLSKATDRLDFIHGFAGQELAHNSFFKDWQGMVRGYVEGAVRRSHVVDITVVGIEGGPCSMEEADLMPQLLHQITNNLHKLQVKGFTLKWRYYVDFDDFKADVQGWISRIDNESNRMKAMEIGAPVAFAARGSYNQVCLFGFMCTLFIVIFFAWNVKVSAPEGAVNRRHAVWRGFGPKIVGPFAVFSVAWQPPEKSGDLTDRRLFFATSSGDGCLHQWICPPLESWDHYKNTAPACTDETMGQARCLHTQMHRLGQGSQKMKDLLNLQIRFSDNGGDIAMVSTFDIIGTNASYSENLYVYDARSFFVGASEYLPRDTLNFTDDVAFYHHVAKDTDRYLVSVLQGWPSIHQELALCRLGFWLKCVACPIHHDGFLKPLSHAVRLAISRDDLLAVAANTALLIMRYDTSAGIFWNVDDENASGNLSVCANLNFNQVAHTTAINSVAWSPDGRWLATAATEGSIGVWEVRWQYFSEHCDHQFVRWLHGHNGSVNSVAWSPDGKKLATGSDDRAVCIWDVGSEDSSQWMQIGEPLHGHEGAVRSVDWSPYNNNTLASSSEDGTVRMWTASSFTV